MKRAGFTMIELIFVIVILGILAAVAIPKLAATRTDAEVAKMATNVATIVSDIGSYWTSKGTWGTATWGDVTNVNVDSADSVVGTAKGDAISGDTVYINNGTTDGCFSFAVTSDGNVTVADLAGSDPVCKGAQTKAASLVKVHSFGGTGVQ